MARSRDTRAPLRAERAWRHEMADFRELGFCLLPGARLSAETCEALRLDLDPWFASELRQRKDGSFGSRWHPGPEKSGTGRVAVSNALVELAGVGRVAAISVDFMLRWELLHFARAALDSTPQLDDVMIAAYPHVGEGGHNEPAAVTDSDGYTSDIHVWHRDSHNHHGELANFHRTWDGTTDNPPPARPYSPPSAINYLCYLQDAVLRLLPRSHLDFTEIPFSGAHRRPHPRELVLNLKAGEVVAVHNDLLHSGMLCSSRQHRRYFLSVYFTVAGLPSRNLPSCVQETSPDHPLRIALATATEETRRCFGMVPPSGSAWDFLLKLEHSDRNDDAITQNFTNGILLAGVTAAHRQLMGLRACSKLLASWGCDQPTVDAGMFHAIYSRSGEKYSVTVGDINNRQLVASFIGADAERVVHLLCEHQGDVEETHICGRDRCMLAAVRLAIWVLKLQHADSCVPVVSPKEALADVVALEDHGTATGVLLGSTKAPRVSWELATRRMETAAL